MIIASAGQGVIAFTFFFWSLFLVTALVFSRAACGYFTLRLLGYSKVMVYDGSMAEWNNRIDTPVETQPNPTVSNN